MPLGTPCPPIPRRTKTTTTTTIHPLTHPRSRLHPRLHCPCLHYLRRFHRLICCCVVRSRHANTTAVRRGKSSPSPPPPPRRRHRCRPPPPAASISSPPSSDGVGQSAATWGPPIPVQGQPIHNQAVRAPPRCRLRLLQILLLLAGGRRAAPEAI